MKSTILLPYCPLPADTGGKVEMMKHLDVARGLGLCTLVSAGQRPVGTGWSEEHKHDMESMGFSVALREDECHLSMRQLTGLGYGALCKGLGLERAFGHSNPYHRYAFAPEWWKRHTDGANLAIVNYSYWAALPCSCPKVVVLLDLWSDYMWEGCKREIEDLSTVDLVIVISKDEEKKLNGWGISKTLWSPPLVERMDLPLTGSVGCLGSANKFNIEGLRWLERAAKGLVVRVYGALAQHVSLPNFIKVGRYQAATDPYRECGIVVLPTAGGMGVQIKAIEALAAGRAIVARKGAMRGIPPGAGAWIEVEKPGEMVEAALNLAKDEAARIRQAQAARDYYNTFLDGDQIRNILRDSYRALADA